MEKRDYDYYASIFRSIPKPLAFVDLDYLDENIQAIAQRAGNTPIRIASKSVRCAAVIQRILDATPHTAGIMTFGAHDTLYLAQKGFKQLLVAYPIYDAFYLENLIEAHQTGSDITLMVDSATHVHQINAIAKKKGVTMPLCMDIDMSVQFPGLYFGVYRSSTRTVKAVLALYEEINNASHVVLEGIMGYEAQIAGLADYDPINNIKNPIIRSLKRKSIRRVAQRRTAVVKALQNTGAKLKFINAGGTGSIESSINEELVTEVTAGSGYFAPALFDHYTAFHHLPAAGFALEVTRNPSKDIYTCYGGGYIGSGTTGKNKQPTPYLPNTIKMIDDEGFGEVQTPFHSKQAFTLGDPVFFRHAKAGELCEHFDELHFVQNGKCIGTEKTFRGDNYLSILNK